MNAVRIRVYLGPTLAVSEARGILDADFRPPLGRDDLPLAVAESIDVIGIIDGSFIHAYSGTPTQILQCLRRGLIVYGAASAGALRAVECADFGMRGVGSIHELYRSGFEAEDELAVSYDPETLRPLSEAMINVRYTCDQAVADGVIRPEARDQLVWLAKSLYFSERTWHRLFVDAEGSIPTQDLERLQAYRDARGPDLDLKRADARRCLREMGEMAGALQARRSATPPVSAPSLPGRLAPTTSSVQASERYADGVDRLLAERDGARQALEEAALKDPGLAVAHAALAYLARFQGRVGEARSHVGYAERAVAAQRGGFARGGSEPLNWEAGHVAAISAAAADRWSEAVELARRQLALWPRDGIMAGLVATIASFSGRGRQAWDEIVDLMGAVTLEHGPDWVILRPWAHACHELGDVDAAEALARRALELYPDQPAAHHALVHVAHRRGDHVGGRAAVARGEEAGCAAGLASHLAWHDALLCLAAGDHRTALGRYDRDILPLVEDARGDAFVDAASLLWSLQMRGVDVKRRWGALLPWARSIVDESSAPFETVHAGLVLVSSGGPEDLDRLAKLLPGPGCHPGDAASDVVGPILQAAADAIGGTRLAPLDGNAAVRRSIGLVGGSSLHREVLATVLAGPGVCSGA